MVTDYAEKDLLQFQTSQPNQVFPLPVALDLFAKIIMAIEELHENHLVYRNIRSDSIKIRDNNIYLYDFTLSQFSKRKERIFDVVGVSYYLAPEFFSEDGYGFEVDIWAAGVLFFFMLTNDYPFKFKDKSHSSIKDELDSVARDGFSFEAKLKNCKNPGFIKSNKILEDFFNKIFQYEETQRITIKKIKDHKLMAGYFPEKIDSDFLSVIGE